MTLSQSVFSQACFKAYDAATGQEISVFCAGRPVRFKSCNPDSRPDLEYYDFDKSNGLQIDKDTTKVFTYSTPGSYTVTQVINTGAKGVHQGERIFSVVASPKPRFRATGCGNRTMKVTITDTNYDIFEVAFAGGPATTLSRGGSASFQFAPGQPMQVAVRGRYNLATCSMTADTTVQALPAPALPRLVRVQVQVPDAATGRILFKLEQLQPAYIYLIEKQTAGGFAVLDSIKFPVTAEVSKVLDKVNARDQGNYRIRVTDVCGSVLNAVSNTIYSLPVLIQPGPQHISLSWFPYPDPAQVSSLQLFRDGQLVSTLNPVQNTFLDAKVSCQKTYCYELVAQLSNNTQSVSNQPCASILSNPAPAPPILHSTFTADNQVKVVLTVPASQVTGQIRFQKSVDGGASDSWQAVTERTVLDNSIKKNQVICYQAVYQDSCDQVSPVSNTTCPILLQVGEPENNAVPLSWSFYTGTPGPVQYVLQRLDAGGTVLSSTPVSGNNFADPVAANTSQRLFYRIQGLLTGQEPTYSNTESAAFNGQAWIPTAFSPNGDNLNDVFEVKGRFIQVTGMRIYDRWGQVIFQSQGQGWDGHIKGKEAPVGTYPYIIDWKDDNGRTMTRKGLVSLVK